MCLELARILDFIGDVTTTAVVIERNMLLFPDEWKLQLEYVQQLVGAPRGVDRRCCRTGWWWRCG